MAIIGAGRAGLLHATNISEWSLGATLACVVEPDENARQRASASLGVGSFSSMAEALDREEFDAVVITTPTFTHADLAVQAAEAGKHIFCEKPMAITVDECDAMEQAASRAGVGLQIGFVRRFQREFAEAKAKVVAGDIGEPMLVKSLTRGPGLPPPWAWDLRRSNGMLAEVNSHDFDCVRWLMGSEIERVYTETANFKGREVPERDFYDSAVVTLRFATGAIGTIDGTCPAGYGYDARAEVLGTEGLLVIGQSQATSLLELRTRGSGNIPTFESWAQRFDAAYQAELASFVRSVREGSSPSPGPADGRAAVVAARASNRSWMEGKPVLLASEGGRAEGIEGRPE